MSAQKVMVVEDSPPNKNILSLTFTKMGFEVEGFNNGEEAWARLQESPEGWALVFSDLMMPKMDGFELLKKVRGHESLKDLPFFLITAMSDMKSVAEAKALKVSGYVVKPATYAKVLAKVQPLYPDKRFPQPA